MLFGFSFVIKGCRILKKAASFLLAVLIAAGTVPMAGNTSAEIDMNDLPTPISSDAKAVKSF